MGNLGASRRSTYREMLCTYITKCSVKTLDTVEQIPWQWVIVGVVKVFFSVLYCPPVDSTTGNGYLKATLFALPRECRAWRWRCGMKEGPRSLGHL